MENFGNKCIIEEENIELNCIPSEEKVKECVWSLHLLKSPRPDGYSGIFFQSYWKIVKEKVVKFNKECFKRGVIPDLENRTFIILIPKTDQPSNFNHFKPISLCNFTYKVVSKILTRRISKLVGKIISPNQGAFVKGRWTAENSIVGQEVIQKVKKHKGKQGLMVMKIDLKKAFDKMECSFLIKALEEWGFDEKF